MKVKAQNGMRLVPRDVGLLVDLYRNVVLSFPQVCQKAFSGRAKSTVLNRLAKLEAMALISRWKVPRLRAGVTKDEILVVFQITKRGIRELERWQPGTCSRELPVGLNGYALLHDVLLVDVMDALAERFPGSKIIHGKLFEAPSAGERLIEPDAVIELAGSKERIAVELELTAKTERRYREIVLRYRLDRTFTRVLYITETPRVENKLARVLGHRPGSLALNPSPEKFLVIRLEELFQPKKGETAA